MWLLAWRNVTHDRTKFAVAVAGIAFASFLMVLQGSLLYGFTMAASRVIDAADADLWITARGVTCFDFASTIEERLREVVAGVEGVSAVGRVATGWVIMQKADGVRQMIVMVGLDSAFAGRIPHPRRVQPSAFTRDRLSVDRSEAALLGALQVPSDVEVNQRRARITHLATGFESFLGAPYVFADYADAKEYVGVPVERTLFLLVRASPGADMLAVRERIRRRVPELDVWTTQDFSRRSRIYWLVQTGAGGALSLAAILGFLIGVAVVSQTIYATTMEHLDEVITLRALGAPARHLRGVVLLQAGVCGLVGGGIGFLAVRPAVAATRYIITWVQTPSWMYLLVGAATAVMCLAASVLSVRTVASTQPARVFRA